MIIGITGGTGSGKTTLLRTIQEFGGEILDCDAIYHHLLKTDANLQQAIEDAFPGTVKNGEVDRKKLGAVVFADPAALAKLNQITHGAVKEEVLRCLAQQPKLAAIDAIGLFEGGLAPLCQVTVAVTAPKEIRVQRLMQRDGITESYARSRIAAQREDAWFREKCDYVLENDGTSEDFQEKCVAFLSKIGIMKEKS